MVHFAVAKGFKLIGAVIRCRNKAEKEPGVKPAQGTLTCVSLPPRSDAEVGKV